MPKLFIEMLEGRTLEQKRELVKAVTAAVADSLNIAYEEVLINIHENPKENVAKGGILLADRK